MWRFQKSGREGVFLIVTFMEFIESFLGPLKPRAPARPLFGVLLQPLVLGAQIEKTAKRASANPHKVGYHGPLAGPVKCVFLIREISKIRKMAFSRARFWADFPDFWAKSRKTA